MIIKFIIKSNKTIQAILIHKETQKQEIICESKQPTLYINGNDFSIGKEEENSINVIKELIQKDEIKKEYSIDFCNTNYSFEIDNLVVLFLYQLIQDKIKTIENIQTVSFEIESEIEEIKGNFVYIQMVLCIVVKKLSIDHMFGNQKKQIYGIINLIERFEHFESYKEKIHQMKEILVDSINKNEISNELKQQLKPIMDLIDEIINDNDYCKESFNDIRSQLKTVECLPLKLKKSLNISSLDNYTVFIASRHFNTFQDYVNLELSTSRYQGNMTKFHYNPISITRSTRKFFDHLKTLYIYDSHDDQFIDDEAIIQRIVLCALTHQESMMVENQTKKKVKEMIFLSDVHDWKENTSVINEKINGHSHLFVVIEDVQGNKNGIYIEQEMTSNEWIYDKNALLFSSYFENDTEVTTFKPVKNGKAVFYLYPKEDKFLFSIENRSFVVSKQNNRNQAVLSMMGTQPNRLVKKISVLQMI